MDYDDRITPTAPRGQHIDLSCRNHPTLRWRTKNLEYIGARTIFFNLERTPGMEPECSCSVRDLYPVEQPASGYATHTVRYGLHNCVRAIPHCKAEDRVMERHKVNGKHTSPNGAQHKRNGREGKQARRKRAIQRYVHKPYRAQLLPLLLIRSGITRSK